VSVVAAQEGGDVIGVAPFLAFTVVALRTIAAFARAAIIAGTAITTTITARTTTITITARTAITAIAPRAIAARFACFTRRAGVFQFGTGFLIDNAHRQANLAARIDFENLDLHGHTL